MHLRKRGYLLGVIALAVCSLVLSGCKSAKPPAKKNGKKATAKKPAAKKPAAKKGAKKPDPKKGAKKPPAKKPMPGGDKLTAAEKAALLRVQQNVALMKKLRDTAKAKLAANKATDALKDLYQARSLNQDVKGALSGAKMTKFAPELAKVASDVDGLIKSAQQALGKSKGEMDTIAKMLREQEKIRRQQAEVKAKNNFRLGKEALAKKQYDQSITFFNRVNETIRWAPYQLNLGNMQQQTNQLLAKAKREKKAAAEAEKVRQIEKARRQMREQIEKARKAKKDKVDRLFARAIAAFKRSDFAQSEELAKEILREDPLNKVARRLHEDSVESRHEKARMDYVREKVERWRRFKNDMLESRTPYADLLRFPSDERWQQISRRESAGEARRFELAESDAVKKIRSQLDQKRITLDFTETPFEDVVQFIQQVTQVNIVIDQAAKTKLAEGGGLVTLNVKDIRLKDALNLLLKFNDLSYAFKEDVLFITTSDSEHARGLAVPRIHDIRDLTVKINDFPGPDIKLGNVAQGGTTGAIFSDSDETQPTITKEALVELIKSSIQPTSWEEEKYSLDAIGGQLLVVHTPEVQNKIAEFMQDLRQFAGLMVHVETRFIEATDDFLEDVGVDFRGLGFRAGSNVLMGGNFPNAQQPNPEGNPTAGFFDNTGTSSPFSTPTQFTTTGLVATGSGPFAGFFAQNSAFGAQNDIRARTEHFIRPLGAGPGRLTNSGGLVIQTSKITGDQFNMIVRAVRKTQDATTLSSPRVTAFNTQRAYVTVVNQQAYIKDYDVEIAQNSVAADPEIGTIQDGLVLDVRPTVSHDRKYVTLELRPTVSFVVQPLRQLQLNLGGTSSIPVTLDLPSVTLHSAETTVRVPDRGGVVIGGLKAILVQDFRSEIPILSKIPLLGFFFSRKGKGEALRNLMVVAKATIIDLGEEEEVQGKARALGTGQ